MEFLDRVDERKRLERFLRQPEGAMACLYGRRRIGPASGSQSGAGGARG